MPPSAIPQPFIVRGDRSDVARFLLVISALAAGLACLMNLLPHAGGPQSATVALATALTAASWFAFACWLHRAVANLQHLGAPSRLHPSFAVLLLFLPLANILVSVVVLYILWRRSGDPREKLPVFMLWPAAFNIHALVMLQTIVTSTGAVAAMGAFLGCIGALGGAAFVMRVDARQWTQRGVMSARASASAARTQRSASTPPPPESIPPVSLPSPQP